MTKRTLSRALLALPFFALSAGAVGCSLTPVDSEGLGEEAGLTDETSEALVRSGVTLKTTVVPRFVGATNSGGSTVVATATAAQAWETFALDDINGGTLNSGDTVTIRTGAGQYFRAVNGGGAALDATATAAQGWETFTIVKASGSGAIANGDAVGLRASTGQYIRAVNGGGGAVDVTGAALSTWEQFTIGGLSAPVNADPTCSTGIRNGDACCPAACGACGGTGCGSRPGGTAACCTGPITTAAVSCSGSMPPCVVSGGTTPPPPTAKKRVIGYVPNWYGSYASWVNKVDWEKVTHLNLAFATADGSGNLQLGSASDIDTLVNAAHARGVKVFPSLGGAGGDASIAPWYTAARVDAFVDRIIAFAKARKFDGIDVDQENGSYLGANYNTFISKLKAKASANGLQISAAVAQTTGIAAGTLQQFDFINLMSYDNAGTWSGAGEHSSYSQAQASINFYLGKGVARDRIVLGVPFYGYCWGNCGGSSSEYILYKDILARFSWASTTDWIQQNGATYSFNGVATMQRKTDLGEQYGGIMIWELGGDVSSTNSASLLRAIDGALP